MIGIINYGLGNIKAFSNIYKRLNIDSKIVSRPEDLENVTGIILPGVGSFDHAMSKLSKSGMREKLEVLVLQKKIPVLGICVGMQMLGTSSEEGVLPGLGWLDASVKKLDPSLIAHKTKLPHMGWNGVNPLQSSRIMSNLDPEPRFYFLHSYYFECNRKQDTIATSEYGFRFTCAVSRDNIYGVQFHPEKSHGNGVQVLKNFAEL